MPFVKKLVGAAAGGGGSGGGGSTLGGGGSCIGGSFLFSIFVKGEGAPTKGPFVHWNSLDPVSGEFKLQASSGHQFGDAENNLMRQCLCFCLRNPSATVLLGVYDGMSAGRAVYHLFEARLTAEQHLPVRLGVACSWVASLPR